MSAIAFIPARGGSKSIPHKNIESFYGKPLIQWVIDASQNALSIDQIVVATDSDAIEDKAKRCTKTKLSIFRRSVESASDTASTEMVLLEFLDATRLEPDTIIVLLQATSPFTTSTHIDEALRLYKTGGYDSLLSCCRTKHFYWDKEGKSLNYDFHNRPRRQDFEGNLQENGALYISTAGNILSSRNRLSGTIGIYTMPDFTSLELDEPVDWEIGETIMEFMKK